MCIRINGVAWLGKEVFLCLHGLDSPQDLVESWHVADEGGWVQVDDVEETNAG